MLTLISTTSYAQTSPDTMWTKQIGGTGEEYALCVEQTSDGGYIICGTTYSFGSGGSDIWLIKTNEFGDTLWTKTYGGDGDDHGTSVKQTDDNGYILTGIVDFETGNSDTWLIKTNELGNLQWVKIFGGDEDDRGNSLKLASDGGYIIAGETDSFGMDSFNLWLIKTDENGDSLWTKTIGGNSSDVASDVCQTKDGGYVMTGRSNSWPFSDQIIISKTDEKGDLIWLKAFGKRDLDDRSDGYSVEQTSDEGYIIAGTLFHWDEGYRYNWVLKTDANGDTIWTKKIMSGAEFFMPRVCKVRQTKGNGYILVGVIKDSVDSVSNTRLIKLDEQGDVVWTKIIKENHSTYPHSIKQTHDNGYIVAGYKNTSLDTINNDLWLVKFAPDVSNIYLEQNIIRDHFAVEQNYPNPFNPSTTIEFDLAKASDVRIEVYNITGQNIQTLFNNKLSAGRHQVEWDASGFASGVYYYRIEAGEFVDVKKMVLLR
jgi:hypothetical protein